MPISLRLDLGNPLILQQLFDEGRPFFPQHVGTGQRTVSSTDGEAVDPEMNEVLSGLESTFAGSDWGASGTRVRSGHRRGGAPLVLAEPDSQEGHRDDPIKVPP